MSKDQSPPRDIWDQWDVWVTELQQLSQDKNAYPLAKDSLLAGDEPGVPGGVSVAAVARALLDAAVDDLASAYALMSQAGRLSPVGIPTLVRGTIELAGLGMWVLTGEGRQGRQERALRVAYDSHFNASKFFDQVALNPLAPAHVLSEATDAATSHKNSCQTLAVGASLLGLRETRVTAKLDRTSALKAVDQARQTPFYSNWQLCSGFAHGLAWAPQFFHQKIYSHDMEGGGTLTGRTFALDSAFSVLAWGKHAIDELTGTFAVGRMPAPGARSTASLVSGPKNRMPPGDR